jgi:HEPN domain-containing protein
MRIVETEAVFLGYNGDASAACVEVVLGDSSDTPTRAEESLEGAGELAASGAGARVDASALASAASNFALRALTLEFCIERLRTSSVESVLMKTQRRVFKVSWVSRRTR